MPGPHIIVLHGPSSVGKSTLAKAVQDAAPVPFWHVSIDKIRDAGVLPSTRFASGEFDWPAHRQAFFDGFHASLVGFAKAGNNLIIEHIFETPHMRDEVRALLAPFHPFYVGLHVPLDVLNTREAARGDRRIGSAAEDFVGVHAGMEYDLELSGLSAAEENAHRILETLHRTQ